MRVAFSSLSVITLSALIISASGCTASGQRSEGASAGRGNGVEAVPVVATPAVLKAVPLTVEAIGAAEAYSTVAIHAQITGELTSVNFKEGDDVRMGDVLFTLDKRPLEAALNQAQANLARDQAQAANASAQAQRYQDLADRGIATREQLDTQMTAATALDSTVVADRAAVDNATVQLQYATITAPLSGKTGALMVHAGNLVRANDTTALVVINQLAPIYVSFAIPEAQLGELKRYMTEGSTRVEVKPPTEATAPATGNITFVDNAVDQTTGTIRVKASFENADRRLWPGQFLNVTITLKTDRDAIVIPTAAVQTGQQGSYVFVIKPDQTADLRSVEVERTAGDDSIIKSGVKAGEIIVTDGQLRLVAGSRVTIKPEVQGAQS